MTRDLIFSERSASFSGIPVVLLSAATDIERVARRWGIRFVKKPIHLELLLNALRSR